MIDLVVALKGNCAFRCSRRTIDLPSLLINRLRPAVAPASLAISNVVFDFVVRVLYYLPPTPAWWRLFYENARHSCETIHHCTNLATVAFAWKSSRQYRPASNRAVVALAQ